MAVITISRQYASGGSNIARLVAGRVGWPLADNEFVDAVAEQAGLSRKEVEEREERVPGLIERIARALAISSPEVFVTTGEPAVLQFGTEAELVRATEVVIARLVAEEPNLIMVGRGAQACLAQHERAMHVYVVAPRDLRIEAAMRRLDIDRDEAKEAVDRTDAGRRRYVKTHYDRVWDEAANYDLVINTGKFTYEQAADLVVEAAQRRGWGG